MRFVQQKFRNIFTVLISDEKYNIDLLKKKTEYEVHGSLTTGRRELPKVYFCIIKLTKANRQVGANLLML